MVLSFQQVYQNLESNDGEIPEIHKGELAEEYMEVHSDNEDHVNIHYQRDTTDNWKGQLELDLWFWLFWEDNI